ncbi:hypothetical protein AVEN_33678-1, partial [Araneus ventricosus]
DIDPIHQDIEPIHQAIDPIHQDIEPIHQYIDPIHQDIDPFHQGIDPIHQDIAAIEKMYEREWSPSISGDYCWTIKRDLSEIRYKRQDDIEPIHQAIDPIHQDIEPIHQYIDPIHQDIDPFHQDIDPIHQDIAAIEKMYEREWSPSISGDYCWTIKRDLSEIRYKRQDVRKRPGLKSQ